jgi:hypothetical protein
MISTVDAPPAQFVDDVQAINRAKALRASRFFLGVYVHVVCAGLLVVISLTNLFRASPYTEVPGAILVFVVSTIGLYRAIRSRHFFIRIIVELSIILAISVLVFSYVWDYSHDGLWYHVPATIALAEGWNPFFETTGNIWIDSYPHGIWSLRAAFDVATFGFDRGRVINVLFSFSSYWSLQYWIARALRDRLTVLDRALIILAAFNPIVIGELLTNLVDGVLCSLSLSLVCYLMLGRKEANKYALLGAASTCILLVNTKLSGLAFAFIIISCALLLHWIYAGLSFRWFKMEHVRIMTLAAAGLVSVALVGYRPYVTNVVDHGTIIYPPSDVILAAGSYRNANVPPNLRGADHLTKLVHGLFAQTGAVVLGDDSVLKWPFQIRRSEFAASSGVARSGGFGPFFGLIVLSTLACFLGSLSRTTGKLHHEFLVASGIFIFSWVIFPEPYWARYIPMLPISLILLLFAVRERVSWVLLGIPLAFLILNIGPFIAKAAWTGYLWTKNTKSDLASIARSTQQGQLKISLDGRAVDYGLYLEYLLSRRGGFNVTYSLCGADDKPLPRYFSAVELCVGR